LRHNSRLQYGFPDRILKNIPGKADLWIQAASVGEVYLACEILNTIQTPEPVRILLTTNTAQGMEIFSSILQDTLKNNPNLKVHSAYFPFDKPSIMDEALKYISPKLVVLLESELWPGLLNKCKKHKVKVLVINGRMTEKSLSRYKTWPSLWKAIRPDKILAMSNDNAQRFSSLFGNDIVNTMHNIKFDRLDLTGNLNESTNPIRTIVKTGSKFIVLGSIRQEEEKEITSLLIDLRSKNSALVIGLFPRHMHRIDFWKKTLLSQNIPWKLRSKMTHPLKNDGVIVWDTMGELSYAYGIANAAFVGGSLAPVGGQNFLEPLTCGLKPVIGPHWSNFYWVGKKIIDERLVFQVDSWQDVSQFLFDNTVISFDREQTRHSVNTYVQTRQGGTKQACNIINTYLFS
jgi:3-deoxy-D-manno-octulosonic-acid transferase